MGSRLLSTLARVITKLLVLLTVVCPPDSIQVIVTGTRKQQKTPMLVFWQYHLTQYTLSTPTPLFKSCDSNHGNIIRSSDDYRAKTEPTFLLFWRSAHRKDLNLRSNLTRYCFPKNPDRTARYRGQPILSEY
jgi:hypothetical protein